MCILYVQVFLTLIVHVNTVLPRHYAPPYFRMNFQYRTILPPLHALTTGYWSWFMVCSSCMCTHVASV